MSDVSEVKKLGIAATLNDGMGICVKNMGPILVNVVLWLLTVWIPYLNIGTTIAISVGIVIKAGKGEAISFTEIFDPKYRRYMGEFFLTSGLMGLGIGVGFALFIIPGIVIGIAWILALLLVIDKGINPTESLTQSNNLTYGYKGRIFGVFAIAGVVFTVVQAILTAIGTASGSAGLIGFMGFIVVLSSIFEVLVFIGLEASIYKQLAVDA
jgi:putative flippase GtrA